ncbi:hypothetical protein [Tamaricihabitans halophyticus]|nr:hypothetical protein [Tamaricihabitans halophyticus]
MSHKVRICFRVIAGLLLGWALYLFMSPTTLTYWDSGIEISCHSIARAGLGSERYLDEPDSRHYSYSEEAGEAELDEARQASGGPATQPFWEVTDRLENDCNQKRTTTTALMSLALAPAVTLGILGFSGRSREPQEP